MAWATPTYECVRYMPRTIVASNQLSFLTIKSKFLCNGHPHCHHIITTTILLVLSIINHLNAAFQNYCLRLSKCRQSHNYGSRPIIISVTVSTPDVLCSLGSFPHCFSSADVAVPVNHDYCVSSSPKTHH